MQPILFRTRLQGKELSVLCNVHGNDYQFTIRGNEVLDLVPFTQTRKNY